MQKIASGTSREGETKSWFVVILLTICFTFSFIDRQIISLLVEPIKRSLMISDTEFGLLQGISFSIFYVLATFPLAWLSDRFRRSRVMCGCVLSWSAMTMACGMAASFNQLLLARIGLAAAESGLPPAALATMAERFAPRKLAYATTLFMLGPFVGGGMALILGGKLYGWILSHGPERMPFVSSLSAWQVVFLLVGAAGLLPAILLLLISDRGAGAEASMGSGRELFGFFWRERTIFLVYPIAVAFVMIVLSSFMTWLPAALMRINHVSEREIGALFGPVYAACGVIGTLAAGAAIGVSKTDRPDRTVVNIMMFSMSMLWPLVSFSLYYSSLYINIVCGGLILMFLSSSISISSLLFQYLLEARHKARGIGFLGTVTALLGTGLGPILTGTLSDNLVQFPHPIVGALSIIGGTCTLAAIFCLRVVRRSLDRRALADRVAAPQCP